MIAKKLSLVIIFIYYFQYVTVRILKIFHFWGSYKFPIHLKLHLVKSSMPTYIAWTNSVLTEFRLEVLVKIIFWLQRLIVQWNVNIFCIWMNKRKFVWRKRCTEWMAFFWSLEVKACQKCFKKPYAQVGSKSVRPSLKLVCENLFFKKILGSSRLLPQYVTFDACWWKARTSLPFVLFSFACLSQGRVGVGYGMVVREHQSGTLVVVVATYWTMAEICLFR